MQCNAIKIYRIELSKNKKGGKGKKTENDTKKDLTKLRPTKGKDYKLKVNYEGEIEKRELKKKKPTKLKKSQMQYKEI